MRTSCKLEPFILFLLRIRPILYCVFGYLNDLPNWDAKCGLALVYARLPSQKTIKTRLGWLESS